MKEVIRDGGGGRGCPAEGRDRQFLHGRIVNPQKTLGNRAQKPVESRKPTLPVTGGEYGRNIQEPAPKGFIDGIPVAQEALTISSSVGNSNGLDPNIAFPPSGAARLRFAREALVRARDELLCAFGVRNEGGEVGREVRESIAGVERELDVWRKRGAMARGDVAGKK